MVKRKLTEQSTERAAPGGRLGCQETLALEFMVMEGREAQCFSSVTTVKGSREMGFYKKLSRGLHGARKNICRGGTCEVTGPFLWLATAGLLENSTLLT